MTPGPLPTLPSEPPPLLDLPPPGGLRAIVIDPGHGGDEDGAQGPQGDRSRRTSRSRVARRLKAALEARLGVRVLLTREGDRDGRARSSARRSPTTTRPTCSSACTRTRRSGRASAAPKSSILSLAEYGDAGAARRREPKRRRCRCSAAGRATSR